MKNPARLLFVTSLERSGSTLLDLTLGRHPQLVSFGEVARVLSPHGGGGMASVVQRPCSCGQIAEQCPFWQVVIGEIAAREDSLNLTDRYRIFLSHFHDMYGADRSAVDSSKFLRAIEALRQIEDEGFDLRVLFTVRDVRGWGASSRKASARKREIPFGMILTPQFRDFWKAYLRHNLLRYIPFWLPLEWYLRNRSIERFLQRNRLDTMHLSYERFALDTQNVLSDLFRFAGVDETGLEPRAESHIIRGNRMAFEQSAELRINYDYSWFDQLWTQYEAMAWPFVMRKNRKWVYDK